MAVIELSHLEKSFGEIEVLKDISLSVDKGEVISVIGASGSGKSTMLRCINLLEKPSGGKICFHGKDIMDKGLNLSEYRAKVGMVFQQFNLFENMTALRTVWSARSRCCAAKGRGGGGCPRTWRGSACCSTLTQSPPAVRRTEAEGCHSENSVVNPEVILFDEPTSASTPRWSARFWPL